MAISELKDIEGYEGIYKISKDGKVFSLYKNSYLIPQNHPGGYLLVGLCKNGKKNHRTTHRLVAKAFIDNPLNKKEVNHINGIKTDNRVENLEWVTRCENELHAYKIGLKKIGKRKFSTKKIRDKVIIAKKIKDVLTNEVYGSITEASEKTKIKRTTLNAMLKGQNKNTTNLIYLNN